MYIILCLNGDDNVRRLNQEYSFLYLPVEHKSKLIFSIHVRFIYFSFNKILYFIVFRDKLLNNTDSFVTRQTNIEVKTVSHLEIRTMLNMYVTLTLTNYESPFKKIR